MSKSLKIQLALGLIFFITFLNLITTKEIKKIREETINQENIQKSKRTRNKKVTNKSDAGNFFGGKNITIDLNAKRNLSDSDDPFDDYTDPKYSEKNTILYKFLFIAKMLGILLLLSFNMSFFNTYKKRDHIKYRIYNLWLTIPLAWRSLLRIGIASLKDYQL
jgi:hypothetical protein